MLQKGLKKDIFSFNSYKSFVGDLLTGNNEIYHPDKLEQIKINLHRMNRVEKQFVFDPEVQEVLQEIDDQQIWLLISEPWCIDSAFNVPVIAKMAAVNPNVHLYIILRDQYQQLIDKYLTEGKRSIPKLIIFNDNVEIGTWGPRPMHLHIAIRELKETNPHLSKTEIHALSVQLYNKDRGNSTQREIAHILDPYFETKMCLTC